MLGFYFSHFRLICAILCQIAFLWQISWLTDPVSKVVHAFSQPPTMIIKLTKDLFRAHFKIILSFSQAVQWACHYAHQLSLEMDPSVSPF